MGCPKDKTRSLELGLLRRIEAWKCTTIVSPSFQKSIRKKVLDDSDEEDNESMGGDEPEAANEAVADSGHLDVKQNKTSEVSVTKVG